MKAKKGLILCVDDEPNLLRSLHWLLHKEFDVMTAPSGLAALDMLRKHDFDVVISDQRMPGMIGSEFLREVCRIAPRTMRILLTGYSDMQAILRSINEGEVFRFVNKPWINEELTRTVAEAAVIAKSHPTTRQASSIAGVSSILLVDDDDDMARMIREVIEPGTTFIHACTVAEAVNIINRQPITAIVSETRVDGVDTTPMIKLLKQQRPEIVSVIFTVDSDVDAIIKLINQGQVYRFLPKPVKPGFLKIILASAIQKHRELKDNPALLKRHVVERVAPDTEARLIQHVQQEARRAPAVATKADDEINSILGRVTSSVRRLFGNLSV